MKEEIDEWVARVYDGTPGVVNIVVPIKSEWGELLQYLAYYEGKRVPLHDPRVIAQVAETFAEYSA